MKKITNISLITILTGAIGLSHVASAAVLYNLDFMRDNAAPSNAEIDDTWTPVLTDGIGTAQDDDWNIINTGAGTTTSGAKSFSNLVDTEGNASTISFTTGSFASDGYPTATNRDGVWTSYFSTTTLNSTGGTAVNLSGFDAGQEVNLILYTGHARWTGANQGEFTFGGTTKGYTEAVSSADMPVTEGVTYVYFDGLIADAGGNINGSFGTVNGGESTAVFAGLQIQTVPEPSSTLLLGLEATALIFRRRK